MEYSNIAKKREGVIVKIVTRYKAPGVETTPGQRCGNDYLTEKNYPKPPLNILYGELFDDILPVNTFLQFCFITNYSTMHLLPDGMILANSFEETFGHLYGQGSWCEFTSESFPNNIRRSVVALTSWSGGRRHFACTGFFIEWTNGYKIILTSASLGGIGGPLVDLDGNVLGMNFYDKKIGTPYLRWHVITALLKLTSVVTLEGPLPCYAGVYLPGWNGGDNANLNRVFDQTACTSKYCFVLPQSPPVAPDWTIETGNSVTLNRWPVPLPYWRQPDDMEEEEPPRGFEDMYTYVDGVRLCNYARC
uniref:Uncharacterized protein n=1 Tax=Oryza barthii TaxID=65489 RepID=A0A0D3FR78_9ORYZ